MDADGAGNSERLRLHADLLAAEEQARALRARVQRTESELDRVREDLAAERDDRERDAEWFRQALMELRTAAEEARDTERAAEDLRAALDEARAAIGARDAVLTELREELERRVHAESETLSALDALRERATALERDPPPVAAEAPPDAPAAAEPPVEDEAPVADEPPPEPPVGDEAPTAAEAPVDDDAPVATEAPAMDEPPVADEPAPEPPATDDAPSGPVEAAPEPAAPQIGRFDRRPPWPEGTADLGRAEIDWHAGYVNSRFRVLVYQPNRKRGTTAAAGSNYRWLLMGEPAPDSPEFVAEVERLAAALEEAGWEPIGEGAAWFSRRYVWRHDPPAPEELRLAPLEAFQRS